MIAKEPRSPLWTYRVRGNHIGGMWTEPAAWMAASSPVNDSELSDIPASGATEVRAALQAARSASEVMRKLSIWDRARLCRTLADSIERRRDELAVLLTIDQGKPIGEAEAEIDKAVEGFGNVSEMIKWLEGRVISTEDSHKRVIVRYVPKGVQAIVTPWNFPINIPVEYIAPGLAAGNSIVWVPAPSTSVCAAFFMEVMAEADLPSGALNLVIGSGAEAGAALVAAPEVDVVGFTGSAATGQAVAKAAAGKSMLLELGGNSPVVVLDDADLELAVKGILAGALFNCGQTCTATGRVIVDAKLQPALQERLVEEIAAVAAGNPLDRSTAVGPLNNHGTLEKVERHLEDARQRGAQVLVGGTRLPNLGSLYIKPAIVTNVPEDSLLNREETFGPVIPLVTVDGVDEAFRVADDNLYGLSSAVFTRSLDRAERFTSELRSGTVIVNDSSLYWEIHVPVGGASGRKSGIGRIGGVDAIKELSDRRTIVTHTG